MQKKYHLEIVSIILNQIGSDRIANYAYVYSKKIKTV